MSDDISGSITTGTSLNGDMVAGPGVSGQLTVYETINGGATSGIALNGVLAPEVAPEGQVISGNEIEGQIVGGPQGPQGETGPQGAPGVVQAVVAGTGISIDSTNPANPIVTNTQTSAEWGNITGTLSSQTDLDAALANKVDKVAGKQLSTNDYTNLEKTKLSGIEDGAEKNVNSDWNAVSGDAQILNKPTIPTKTSDLTNDSSFITSAGAPVQSVNSKTGTVSLTTADISDSTNKRYITDAQQTVLGNTSNTNTGDQDLSGLVPKTTTVNSKALSTNITLNIDDVAPTQTGNSGKVLKTDGTNATWQTDAGGIASVVAGNNIDVDNSDPNNPILSVENLTLADITDITATATEVNYIDGVTSAIQTQINAKANDSDTVHKTGAETVAGSKTFSNDLSVNGTSYLSTTNVYGDLTMKTGTHLVLDSDPTTNLQAATKQYVDTHSGNTNERLQNEDRDATYAYVGYENTSDSSWYIYRRTRATNLREYATGLSSYATNWTNRGSLTYV